MEANIFYPCNLNLHNFYFPNFKKHKIKHDYAYYIVHLICSIPLWNDDYDAFTGVPLNAKALQEVKSNYREYLDWLIENGVIETNNYYEEGNSRKYRLSKRYQTRLIENEIYDFTLKRKIIQQRKKRAKSTKGISHLTKHFNSKLEFNYELANHYVNAVYSYKIDNPERWDINYKTMEKKNPLNQINSAFMSMNNLSNAQYYLSRDNTSGRFHSPITSMQSDLRNCLTYDGQPLINIDKTNSQPYLLNALLDNNTQVAEFVDKSFLDKDIKESYKRLIYRDLLINKAEFSDYKELTSKGIFYEYMANELELNNNIIESRKQVKSTMFQVLFTDNKYYYQSEAKNKRKFNELFPSVYQVFNEIKRNNKSHLAILLQSIESYIVIDVVTRKIALKHPEIPLFTIHDSIATTEQYLPYVKQVFNDELCSKRSHV